LAVNKDGSLAAFVSTYSAPNRPLLPTNVFSKGKISQLKLKNQIIKSAAAAGAVLEDGHILQEGCDIYSAWTKGVGPSPVPWSFKKDMVPHSLIVKEIKDIISVMKIFRRES